MAHQSRTSDQKTVQSFSKALELIDQFRKSTQAKPDPSLELLLWKCAAEVEYLAFRVANIYDLVDYDPPIALAQTFSADHVRDLIDEAKTLLGSDSRGAYKNLREAVEILRKLSRTVARDIKPTENHH